MLTVALLSMLSWGTAGLSMVCYVWAFRLAVPWQAGMLVLVTTNLGGAIPSSPGAIGIYEFFSRGCGYKDIIVIAYLYP